MERLGNDFATTLAAAISTVGQSSVQVASNTGAPSARFRVRIDDEILLVTANPSTTWTVLRGQEGTTAATHALGADVVHVVTAAGLDLFVREHGPLQVVPQVPVGEVRTVPAGTRLAVHGSLEVEGELNVAGEVLIV